MCARELLCTAANQCGAGYGAGFACLEHEGKAGARAEASMKPRRLSRFLRSSGMQPVVLRLAS